MPQRGSSSFYTSITTGRIIGCRSSIYVDNGSYWVPVTSASTAPGCVSVASFGFSTLGCTSTGGVGGTSFLRVNLPPSTYNYCPPPVGCGDEGNSSEEENATYKDNVPFASEDLSGGVEGDSQPQQTPSEGTQAADGQAATDSNDRPVNSKGVPYPKMIDPRTGNEVPFPSGDLQQIPEEDRVVWDNYTRGVYIAEWIDKGYDVPDGGWPPYDIHHILPKEYGGTNDFWNLVPLERNFHQQVVTPWWNAFEP